jgi:hypothetical protein
MLLVPQHRPLGDDHLRALMEVLAHTARMYPVPDGVANLDSDDPGGIRIAILPPTNYRDHLDPADVVWADRSIAYDQGFLLRDHNVGSGPGGDGMFGTSDDPFTFEAGEYLPINFTAPEDENRNGRWDDFELARVSGGDITRRFNNWVSFAQTQAESRRQGWNQFWASLSPRTVSFVSGRAIAIVTGTARPTPQNRTGLWGQAQSGDTSFWATIDPINTTAIPPDDPNDPRAVIPHETGHAFGFDHPTSTCSLQGEAINLLTRRVISLPSDLMCGEPPPCTAAFMKPSDYNQRYDRLARGG